MRALAEVEYKIRLKALESLEKYGGVEKKSELDNRLITTIRLKKPVYVYLALWNKLYVMWGEFDGLPKNGQLRVAEVERRVADVIERHRRGERVDAQVEEFEIDDEYRRLWLEVPLPEGASKLLGGRAKAPVALFRNLGWLLSDDWRKNLGHITGNTGQAALRLFDWIAIVKYIVNSAKNESDILLMFKLATYYVDKTEDGSNPKIEMRPIGMSAELVRLVYGLYGITLGKAEDVITKGYSVLRVLREGAFKRDGEVYVVDDVGAWIAFSNAVNMLVVGDGYVMPIGLRIVAKASHEATLMGEVARVNELAEALGGAVGGKEVVLQTWHMRLLLPTPSTLAFEKTVKLYETLVNYPVVAVVELNGTKYLLTHDGNGRFVIGKKKAVMLYKTISQFGLQMGVKREGFVLTYTQLKELAMRNVPVRLLNDLEKDAIKEVKAVLLPDLEVAKRVLEMVAKMARITVILFRGRTFIMITPYDKSKAEEIAAMLKAAGIRFSISRQRKRISIYEQKSVEIIRKIMPHLFSSSYIPAPFFSHKSDPRILAQSAYINSFCYYTHIGLAFPLPFTFLLSNRRQRRCPTKIHRPTRRLLNALRS